MRYQTLMSPDELLDGDAGPKRAMWNTSIPLPNKTMKQLKLHDFWRKAPKKQRIVSVQLSLHTFFKGKQKNQK